ncbi:SDR family NAD(P)-dependent oxidoreductase [Sphingobium sp. MP9-4]|jgi:NAD(P)-dependent dehydrogenase (short-subunit alcohol dehydrogenase family)|uniref:SDR family NAD(P)-dependent oxidoreductase n=1 Tax=Sphingobium sp. MP9-4 TaxID=1761936 RepID=UPI001F10D91E|nr:SDR family NAD(P)-dependent oxidoreductase [Sphingobium sp. MP9-4]
MSALIPKTFLITGVSSGLGRAFAEGALDAGHAVVGTVRNPKDAEAFAALAPGRAHPLLLDVTHLDAIPAAVADAERRAGSVDVLVNNAGYGHEGVLEESSIDDLQRQFAANVFGPVAMMKAVLPGMREGGAAISSTSPPWAGSSPCPASASIAAASSRWKGFPKRWARKWRRSAFM